MSDRVLRVRHHIPRPADPRPSEDVLRRHLLKNACLSWPFLLSASAIGGAGLGVRWQLAAAGARSLLRGQSDLQSVYPFLFDAFDTVRHFEFDVCWNWLHKARGKRGLDLSSPRMLPLLLSAKGVVERIVMANPDSSDLEYSRHLAGALGVADKIEFTSSDASSLPGAPGTFDIVTSISVLEHIPAGSDRQAFNTLWDAVAPGGSLVITVPCARIGFEELIDYNEYGLLPEDDLGFVFGQRFYDAPALAALYREAGEPNESRIFGERTAGTFFANRAEKCGTWLPRTWREPTFTARNFARFRRVEDLPGIGVIAMRFEKRR